MRLAAPVAVFAVLLAAAVPPASAQTPVIPKRRAAIPFTPSRPAPDLAPTTVLPPRQSIAGLPTPGDGGASCRSGCARSRYACEVQETSCAPEWTACLKTCSDSASAPRTALLPR